MSRNGMSLAAQYGVDRYTGKMDNNPGTGGQIGKGKFKHEEAAAAPKSLLSVMELASVDEFLVHAELTNRNFEARRGIGREGGLDQVVVVGGGGHAATGGAAQDAGTGGDLDAQGAGLPGAYEWHALPMPERPPWSHSDTAEALDGREVASFVEWRRRIALTEESVHATVAADATQVQARVTPFEKNLEVWRQLWRVVERSDVLIQVVDARQPLFYHR